MRRGKIILALIMVMLATGWASTAYADTPTPTPTGTATATATPDPREFYTFTSTQWLEVPISPTHDQVMGYVQFVVDEPYTQMYADLVGVHVKFNMSASSTSGLRFAFVASNRYHNHFAYWSAAVCNQW